MRFVRRVGKMAPWTSELRAYVGCGVEGSSVASVVGKGGERMKRTGPFRSDAVVGWVHVESEESVLWSSFVVVGAVVVEELGASELCLRFLEGRLSPLKESGFTGIFVWREIV